MKKIRAYFYSLKKSLISPDYYQDVLKAKFSFSLKFFFFSCFLLSLVLGTIYSYNAHGLLKEFILKLEDLPQFYPEDLVVEIKNGQVKTNQPEPYFMPLPFSETVKEYPLPSLNLLVIDTQANIEDITQYQTLALLTSNSLAFRTSKETQEIRVYPLTRIQDFTLDQVLVKTLWQKISVYFKYLVPLATLFIFLGLFMAIPFSKFIHLLIFSLITLVFARILKTGLSYKKSLQVNLHAFLLPTLVQVIFDIGGLRRIPIPFFYSLILLIFNLVILASLRGKKVSS